MSRRLVRLSEAAYAAVLRAYPPALRARYGREMRLVFREACDDALERAGPGGLLALWRETLGDLARTLPREWAAAARRPAELDVHGSITDHRSPDTSLNILLQDLRFAVRTLRRNLGVAAVVVLSLALGIGANTLIFSIVDGVVLRPFPYPEPDRLVAIGATFPALGGSRQFLETISPPELADIRSQVTSLEKVIAFDLGNRNISGGDMPDRVFTAFVWGNPFETFGMAPALGRGFSADETLKEGPPVGVISHRTWISRFGADSSIVGKSIRVNGQPVTVIGVMPPRFFLAGTDLWLPIAADPAALATFPRKARQYAIVARLAPGATLAAANTQLTSVVARTRRQYGGEMPEYQGWRLEAATWVEANVGESRGAARLLLGAVGAVLLIACANIASLLLARAARREREIAVRRALGAGRARIARQLLTESLLLAAVGGALGLALAYGALRPTVALLPQAVLPTGAEVALNGRVLLLTLGLTVLAGLVFGLAPALRGARREAYGWLAAAAPGGGRSTLDVAGRRTRHVFVVAEVALALALLAGAGVLVRSFARLQQVDPGFRTRNVLTMRLSLPREKYQGEAVPRFFEEAARRIEGVAGVRAAGATTQFPLANFPPSRITLEHEAATAAAGVRTTDVTNATPGFFRALGYTLRRGRLIGAEDGETSPRVAVLNETAARRFFPGADAVGRRIRLGEPEENGKWIEVVGVVADVRNHGLSAAVEPEVFVPVRQMVTAWNNQLFFVIRTEAAPMGVLPAVRAAITSLDPEQPVYAVRTLDDVFAASTAQRRVATVLLAAFAGLALALAAVGIYGMMSYLVNERTREIGIRMALGAAARDVVGLVVRETLRLVAVGVALGLALALASARVLRTLVFEVRENDPATLAGMALLLGGVAVLAALVPARRASRVMPTVALRE